MADSVEKSVDAVGVDFSASWKRFPNKDVAGHIG